MKDYRCRTKGLADLLNYALMVDEGIILMKDGSLCAGWSYRGPDIYSVEKNKLISIRSNINQIFTQLGNGWILHSDMIRRPLQDYCDESNVHFPDITSLFLNRERSRYFLQQGNHFLSTYTFIITYKPPLEIESKLRELFIEDDGENIAGWENILNTFKTHVDQIENSLSTSLELCRLKTDYLLSHIHSCITGAHHPIKSPKFPVYLDQLLVSQDFLGGLSPKVGNKNIVMMGLSGFPLDSYPGMLQQLCELPISFRWSNRFIFLDPMTATQESKKYCRYWFQKKQGLLGLVREIFKSESVHFVDQDALEMAGDADNAIQEIQSGLTNYGYYTSSFILMDEDHSKLKDSVKLLTQELEARGVPTRIETINAVEAYIGSLPGHGHQNIRRPMVSTYNVADFLPWLSIWSGHTYHPSPYYPEQSPPLFYAQTQGRTPFRCSLHVDDVGHTLVVGDTGNGKSTFLGFLITQQLRYQNTQIFMFDKGYSSFTLCHALNGKHYDVAGADEITFAPLQDIHLPSELDWACEWLEVVYQAQDIALSPSQRKEIRQSLQRLSMQNSRTLTDLQASLQDPNLKAALEFYTLSGTMGQLLDSNQDLITSSHLQVFEMQHILNKEEKFALPLLDYLFHQINKRLDVTKPTLILIEEGHRFLRGHFGKQLEVWLRECRKLNAAVIFITQGLAEITSSSYKHILFNSCPTKIFLPNIHAGAAYNKDLYHQVGLSDYQIDIIRSSRAKRDYYLTSPNGNRLMNLALSKAFLAFMDSTNSDTRKQLLELKNQYQDEWVYHYLLNKGLAKEAEEWMHAFKDLQNNINQKEVRV